MCHALLQNPDFFLLLQRIDEEFASETRRVGCQCGGVLHSARYPRKPRGCPESVREQYSWRFSFCCTRCDRRSTPTSVRFLGRRVYVAVVLMLASPLKGTQARSLRDLFRIPSRTLERWRSWWRTDFLQTPFWQSVRSRFVPPPAVERMPQSLQERFEGEQTSDQLCLLLRFVSPLSTRAMSQ